MRRSAAMVGLAVILVAGRARADDDADTLLARGIELREQHKDDEALKTFKRALAKSPTPRARAQVALAEQALGMWVPAENDLLQALSSPDDPWIARNRAALDGALVTIRRHVGSLEVRGPDGAEVLVDGARVGSLPSATAFRVEVGKRTLELREKGFQASTRGIEISAGAVTRETVDLVPVAPDARAVAPGPAPAPAPVPADDDPGHTQRILGYAFLGVGGALLITGGVAQLVRTSVVADYNAQCNGIGAGVTQSASCQSKVDSASQWQTISIVSFIAGGVIAVGGGILLLTAPSRREHGVALGCGPAGLGLSCTGTF